MSVSLEVVRLGVDEDDENNALSCEEIEHRGMSQCHILQKQESLEKV